MPHTKRKWGVLLGGLLLANMAVYSFLPDTTAQAERRQRFKRQQFDPDEFSPQQVVRAFKPIINPNHVDAATAKGKLQPNELVLGIELDGHARAYPINMLTGPSREIFNDKLGERYIAATW